MSDHQQESDDKWEPWREWFSLRFFTTLQGIAAPVWLKHLWRNRFRIEPKFVPRAALISISSPVNSLFAAADNRKYGRAIARTAIEPPIFILGHWRSGTTLLQRFFALDDRFSFPSFYQCCFPRGFLHSQERNSKLWADLLPRTRIFDAMENRFDSPAEDEFALCSLTGYSPYMGWSFPSRWNHYDRYLTFRKAPAHEREEWKKAIRFFVRKIQYKTGRRVVLKSPPHTCRIRLLMETFPKAKFVHIHRDPYRVFPSTKKMLRTFLQSTQLQSFDPDSLDERILDNYRGMYDVFLEERGLVRPGDYCEVGYEELEAKPTAQMERIYAELRLPDFEALRPKLEHHVLGLGPYQKNRFKELPEWIRQRISHDWKRTIEEWGYRDAAVPQRIATEREAPIPLAEIEGTRG